MTSNTNAWTEFCMIGVLPEGGTTEIQLAAITEDISGIEFGQKDIEGAPLVNGGRIVKKKPMEDEMVTLKVYPVSLANDGTGVGQFFGGTTLTTTQPWVVSNSNTRRLHRLVMTWREDLPGVFGGSIGAGSAVAAPYSAYRVTAVNAYCTKYVPSFDDKVLSAEVTFKWAPFDRNGNPNKKEESSGTAGLSAVTSTVSSL